MQKHSAHQRQEASTGALAPCSPLTSAHACNIQGERCLIRVRPPPAAGQPQRKFEVSFSISVSLATQTQAQAAPGTSDGNASLAAVLGVFFGVEESLVDMSQSSTRRVLIPRGGRRQRAEVETSVLLQGDRDVFAAQIGETHTALVAYLGVTPLPSLLLSMSILSSTEPEGKGGVFLYSLSSFVFPLSFP